MNCWRFCFANIPPEEMAEGAGTDFCPGDFCPDCGFLWRQCACGEVGAFYHIPPPGEAEQDDD
jgi:hypothetical protein